MEKVGSQDFFVTMIIMIVIVVTMISCLVMIITLSLRRKPNWKPFVGIETRESFFGWRLEGTAGKFLLKQGPVKLVKLGT